MKKLLVLLLVAAMMLAFTACGKETEVESSSETAETVVSSNVETVSEDAVSEEPASSEEASSKEPVSSKEAVSSQKVETHTHTFAKATCTTPKTCTTCKATEGAALGHKFSAATCKAPKTCSVCKATEGSATAHKYSLGKCSVCGASDPAIASLLSSACYGTYEGMYVESKEGQLIRQTITYKGPTSVSFAMKQYLEVDASESEIQFNGKHYKKWHESTRSGIHDIVVTENSLSYKFEGAVSTITCNYKYKDGVLIEESEEDGIINHKRIS
jgi:hypothetical protein